MIPMFAGSLLLCLVVSIDGIQSLPNIVFMLTDDLGWNSMYHNDEIISPTLDGMVSSSLRLNSFYVYKYCSPTRASFLTGRLPYKLCATRDNLKPTIPEGINLGYTYIAKKLQSATPPYISYQVGKWHNGFYTPQYTPVSRGFNKSYGFLGGGEDHYTQHDQACSGNPVVDLYDSDCPAFGRNGTYNGYAFTEKAIEFIKYHVRNYQRFPFFLYFALHNTHAPIEAPADIVSMYRFNQTLRSTFNAMATVVDQSVKNVTDTLKALDLWENTLFVWTTDNGAPCQVAGSNYPFRGNKGNNFEGGVHVPALLSGGILPSSMKGQCLDGLVHITDFYATFCYLAGIDPVDSGNQSNPHAPAAIDSLNMWPYFSGEIKESQRTVIVHDHLMYTPGAPSMGAIRSGRYKLIRINESLAGWYGQFSPNNSWAEWMEDINACSVEEPCLFDIENDVGEHHDLSNVLPDVTSQMVELFHQFDGEYHPTQKSPLADNLGFCEAVDANGGFMAPWRGVKSGLGKTLKS